MSVVVTDSRDPLNLPMMKEIGEILSTAYPGYSWFVRIDGGILAISTYDVTGTYGRQTALKMVRHFSDIAHDAKRRKHEVVLAAGEMLERARLKRGQATGERPTVFEGGEIAGWKPPIG